MSEIEIREIRENDLENGFIDVGDKETYEKLNLEYRKQGKI